MGKKILFERAKSSRYITVFEIAGHICVLEYINRKSREIGFVRDSGKFEITVFEIPVVDCLNIASSQV